MATKKPEKKGKLDVADLARSASTFRATGMEITPRKHERGMRDDKEHTPKPGAPAIEARGIMKNFKTGNGSIVEVLKSVNVTIQPGEFIMIQGQSGSGKSTFLNVMNGWEQPTAGKLLIEGQSIYDWTEDERARLRWDTVALVHQTPNWVKALNVVDNIAIPHMLARHSQVEARKRAYELLRLLDFDRFALYKPVDLSGGQQQRMSFLRGLINNPRIIMADEPTGNLDSTSSDIVMEFFDRINKELGRTIIMVTHNLELLHFADRVIHVKDGKVDKIAVNRKSKFLTPKYRDVLEMVFSDNIKREDLK
jgi:putative ABC transport system ATP-binding protein